MMQNTINYTYFGKTKVMTSPHSKWEVILNNAQTYSSAVYNMTMLLFGKKYIYCHRSLASFIEMWLHA